MSNDSDNAAVYNILAFTFDGQDTAGQLVKEIKSSSAEGVSSIMIEFMPDIDIDDALQYVRDKVDLAKGDLPDGAEEPIIKEMNIAELPVIKAAINFMIAISALPTRAA